jgi:hypothetical protein
MLSLMRSGRFASTLAALAFAVGTLLGSAVKAQCEGCQNASHAHKHAKQYHHHPGPGVGTLGYGPPGLFPGFQGFGLGYHLGYGYGGDALGPGAEGGYPFYGGPGYPHPGPCLWRGCGITPFPYYGGPGYPTPDQPHYYGNVAAPLVADRPVVEIAREPGEAEYGTGFGPMTGAVPYPEAYLAPFTTRAAATGTGETGRYNPAAMPTNTPPTPATSPVPGPGAGPVAPPRGDRAFGIDAVPVVEAGSVPGMKVSEVRTGTAAEKAGLHAGDVVRSVNGHLTTKAGHLAWIMANAAPNRVLTMTVQSARDGKVHTLTAQLP